MAAVMLMLINFNNNATQLGCFLVDFTSFFCGLLWITLKFDIFFLSIQLCRHNENRLGNIMS